MIKSKGVYTTKCPKCTRTIVMHVLSDGSISPNNCPECEIDFAGLDRGKERNSFVVVVGANKPKLVASDEDKEVKDKKKTLETFQITKKEIKKPFSSLQINKKNNKNSFGW